MGVVKLTLGPQQRKVMTTALSDYIEKKGGEAHRARLHNETEVATAADRKRAIAENLRRDIRNG